MRISIWREKNKFDRLNNAFPEHRKQYNNIVTKSPVVRSQDMQHGMKIFEIHA